MSETIEVADQHYPTKEEVKNLYLTSIRADAERIGATVDVLPGSEYDIRAEAIANQVVPVFANNQRQLAAWDPHTAQDDNVKRGAAVFGVNERPGERSTGRVRIKVNSGSVTIPSGFTGTGPNGKQYLTTGTTLGAVHNQAIDVIADEPGTDSDLSAGATITWDDTSIGQLKRDATVDVGGIADGTNPDSIETIRQRWIRRLGAAAVGGNPAHVQSLAEGASSAIHAAYVYPCYAGAGSYGFAVVGEGGDRSLSSIIVAQAAAAITAENPGHASLNATSVNPEYVDVIFKATAPLPKFAGGAGGGWFDAAPWPNTTSGPVQIISHSGLNAVTDAASLGTLAVGHHVAVWDPEEEELYTFIVSACSFTTSALFQVNGGFPKDLSGCYVSAWSKYLESWVDSAVEEFGKLGPGEITNNVWILSRARRFPSPDVSGAQSLTSKITSGIQNENAEISNLEYEARYETGTTTPKTAPSIPAALTDPPNILVLAHMAFIAAV